MDPADRDLLIKTVAMEASKGSPDEQAAVAHVILNRLGDPQYGKSLKDVLFQKNAFESWGRANLQSNSKNRPQLYAPGVPAYDQAAKIVDGVLSGNIPDPTGGADRFQQPDIVNARVKAGILAKSEAAPQNAQRIGSQVFWSTSPLSQRKITDDAYADLLGKKQPSGQTASAENGVPTDTDISREGYADLLGGSEHDSDAEAAATQEPTSVAESVALSRQQGLGNVATFKDAMRTLGKQYPKTTAGVLGTGAAVAGLPIAGAGAYYAGLPIAAAARAYPPLGYALGGLAGSVLGEPAARAAHSVWNAIEGFFEH